MYNSTLGDKATKQTDASLLSWSLYSNGERQKIK